MADFRIVDLSIFLLPVQTMEHSSFINMLNWSLRFFSLKFLDFLLIQLTKNVGEALFVCSQYN